MQCRQGNDQTIPTSHRCFYIPRPLPPPDRAGFPLGALQHPKVTSVTTPVPLCMTWPAPSLPPLAWNFPAVGGARGRGGGSPCAQLRASCSGQALRCDPRRQSDRPQITSDCRRRAGPFPGGGVRCSGSQESQTPEPFTQSRPILLQEEARGGRAGDSRDVLTGFGLGPSSPPPWSKQRIQQAGRSL